MKSRHIRAKQLVGLDRSLRGEREAVQDDDEVSKWRRARSYREKRREVAYPSRLPEFERRSTGSAGRASVPLICLICRMVRLSSTYGCRANVSRTAVPASIASGTSKELPGVDAASINGPESASGLNNNFGLKLGANDNDAVV